MSPEEKIEAAQKLIAEARAELTAKKQNWLEEAKPGMLFRSNGKVVAIPPRYPVDHAISLDPELIGMSCYGWENAPDIEYLGHARDLIKIANDVRISYDVVQARSGTRDSRDRHQTVPT